MRKVSAIFLVASLLGAILWIGIDIRRGANTDDLRFTAIATLIALPFVIYYVGFSRKKVRRFIVAAAAIVCTLATLGIAFVYARSVLGDWIPWQDEFWLFLTAFMLFGSVALFLWFHFLRLRGKFDHDA